LFFLSLFLLSFRSSAPPVPAGLAESAAEGAFAQGDTG
jgi:hypothetical protein